MEEGAVCASADLINNIGLEIAVDGSGYILALTYRTSDPIRSCMHIERKLTSLGEESAEALVLIGGLTLFSQITIGLINC